MARQAAIKEVRPVLEEIDKVADVVDKGLDAVEKGVDVAAEAVEAGAHVVIEEAHSAVGWVRNPKVAAGIIIVASSVAVGFTTWQLAKRHFTKKFEAELESEIESARKFFGRLNKVDEEGNSITPEDLAVQYQAEDAAHEDASMAADALRDYQDGPVQYNRVTPSPDAEVDVPTTSNVFVDGRALDRDAFDVDEEAKTRSIESPYVISKDEFMENGPEHTQHALTYFAGDEVLADERDQPIEEVEATVGVDNLGRFGHGSGDPSIVYIRNDRTEADFEISHSDGKYSEEVLGFIHSDRPVNRRFPLRADE